MHVSDIIYYVQSAAILNHAYSIYTYCNISLNITVSTLLGKPMRYYSVY